MYEKNGIQHWNRKYMFMFKRDYIYAQSQIVNLAKWLSVHLRTKWLWVRVQLQSQIVNLTYLDYLIFRSNTTHVGF